MVIVFGIMCKIGKVYAVIQLIDYIGWNNIRILNCEPSYHDVDSLVYKHAIFSSMLVYNITNIHVYTILYTV